MTAITDSFVLPNGVVLRPVSELPKTFRREIGSQDGDFVLSRPRSRTQAKVIEADAAELIKEFLEPITIARAVARCSKRNGVSAERLLDDALPMLRSLIDSGLLVRAFSQEALPIQPSLATNDRVGGWRVLRCAQTLEDTEIYQVRDAAGRFAALKIGRGGVEIARRALEREARILSGLDSTVTPQLFESGKWQSRPYVIVEWFAGTDVQRVCEELRRRNDAESRRALLHVTGAVLGAYTYLHEQDIFHGDIHPRNVLVDRNQRVKIVDFGLAHRLLETRSSDWAQRGGIGFFYEPEFARATRSNAFPPPPTAVGEQYSLAALLYLLTTGFHYLDFSLQTNEMLRQIIEAPMVPFARRGMSPWPDVERLLERALNKEPADRFSSVAEFRQFWLAADVPRSDARTPPAGTPHLTEIPAGLLGVCEIGNPLLSRGPMPPPSTSVNYGSAGLAYALYRIACASDNPRALALADVWSDRALSEIGNDGAFYNADFDITPETVGRPSLYHGPAGVFLVQALIAYAKGDRPLQHSAVQAFVEAARQPSSTLDLVLGRAGALLGCTLLLDAMDGALWPNHPTPAREQLIRLGNEISDELWRAIRDYAPVGGSTELTVLGIAHGWAGLLYATMCWCAAAAQPFPDSLTTRLEELADCGEPAGRGLQWKWDAARQSGSRYMPGWCNGSAGYVFLWTQAFQMTGERRHLDLAEGAAWQTWETPTPNATLCCGKAGQAYALLNFYRHSGDSIWLRRAVDVARSATLAPAQFGGQKETGQSEWRQHSLYKGDTGLAVLAADLEAPDNARMPLFERAP
jgi:serine/threonine protein kinase